MAPLWKPLVSLLPPLLFEEPFVCGEESGEGPFVDVCCLCCSFDRILVGAGAWGVISAARCRLRLEPAALLDVDGEAVGEEDRLRRLRGRWVVLSSLGAEVGGWVVGGGAVESGAGGGLLDEEAVGRSLAIGGGVVVSLSSAMAGRWWFYEGKRPLAARGGHGTLVSSVCRNVCGAVDGQSRSTVVSGSDRPPQACGLAQGWRRRQDRQVWWRCSVM